MKVRNDADETLPLFRLHLLLGNFLLGYADLNVSRRRCYSQDDRGDVVAFAISQTELPDGPFRKAIDGDAQAVSSWGNCCEMERAVQGRRCGPIGHNIGCEYLDRRAGYGGPIGIYDSACDRPMRLG